MDMASKSFTFTFYTYKRRGCMSVHRLDCSTPEAFPAGGDGRQQPTWSVDVAVRGGGHAAQVTAAAGPCV